MESGSRELSAQRAGVVSIWLKPRRHAAMESVQQADLIAGRGLVGNAEQGGRRQVTIIDEDAWRAAVNEVGQPLDPTVRRANLMLRGIDLRDSRGRLLRIGNCAIRVFTEVTPCSILDKAHPRLRDALKADWRGGVCGEIVEGGTIRIGDTAEWIA